MLSPHRIAVAAVSVALLATTAACGGGDDEPEATPPSSSPSATQSPSPTEPSPTETAWQDKYTEAQLAGYEDALSRYEAYETRSEPIWAAGKATERAEALFKQYYPSPLWQGRLRLLSSYEQVDVQIEGLADVYWSRAKSIRAEILELLNDLVQDHEVGILYITHDLLSARMLADDVIVLNEGRVVEQGPALQVIRDPQDDYTRTLLDAVPNPF